MDEELDIVECYVCHKDVDLREPHYTLIENIEQLDDGGIDVITACDIAYKHLDCVNTEKIMETHIINIPKNMGCRRKTDKNDKNKK